MTGHMLNERLGKWTFWIFMSGFNICFFPMYFLGLDGMTRRMYTYSESLGWGWLNQIASVGAVMMGIGFLLLCYNVIWSARHGERDTTGDPWDGRTLEWATHSPVQHYNFAKLPEIKEADAFWYMKNAEKQLHQRQKILNQFTCQVTLVCLLLRLDSSVLQVSH